MNDSKGAKAFALQQPSKRQEELKKKILAETLEASKEEKLPKSEIENTIVAQSKKDIVLAQKKAKGRMVTVSIVVEPEVLDKYDIMSAEQRLEDARAGKRDGSVSRTSLMRDALVEFLDKRGK